MTAGTGTASADPGPRRPVGGDGWRYALRVAPGRWDGVDVAALERGGATVAGGWLLLAFARFGIPVVTQPRAPVRFVLVGVYTWLAMAMLVWLLGRLGAAVGRSGPAPDLTRSLQFTALAHQPLVVLGSLLLVGQVVPVIWPFTVIAALTLGVWLPGMLVASMISAFGRFDRSSAGAGALVYLLWAGVAGRYLVARVGHLF